MKSFDLLSNEVLIGSEHIAECFNLCTADMMQLQIIF